MRNKSWKTKADKNIAVRKKHDEKTLSKSEVTDTTPDLNFFEGIIWSECFKHLIQ